MSFLTAFATTFLNLSRCSPELHCWSARIWKTVSRHRISLWAPACAAALAATPVLHLHAQTVAPKAALVAAAANLQPVLAELVPLFERLHVQRLSVTTGSSANLVRQIQQGLSAELFLSADEDLALRLVAAGLTLGPGTVYATGRLVLAVPAASGMALDPQLAGLKAGLGQVRKFAIANPELAPYGKAAAEALQQAGLLKALGERLVLGDSIAQTAQYVSTGAADAGMLALSQVLAPGLAGRLRYAVIPESTHAPLRQRMVLLKGAGPAAAAFYAFLQSPAAREVFLRYGYE